MKHLPVVVVALVVAALGAAAWGSRAAAGAPKPSWEPARDARRALRNGRGARAPRPP
ncbi:hypothetical protein C8E97_6101 [Saccharothrix australiensis]|uniref:Uncharacterized protein n=1 Tax=Saccharothrix australiensis TaxID=2072 RepID=A0A495W6N0_9PSEU|nr:hypothetical protein C8E97_6101 [Saccharothrix australiensis]